MSGRGWTNCTIEELAANEPNALCIGPFGSDLLASDLVDSGVPVVFVRNIRPGVFNQTDMRFVTEAKAEVLRSHRVRAGDIVITKMGLPPCIAAPYPAHAPDGIITADIIKLTPNKDRADARFLIHFLNSPLARAQVSKFTFGVTRPKVTLKDFRNLQLLLPPLPEQRRIADILDKADAIRRKRKEAIALTEQLLRSTFLEMFGDPVTNPKGWPTVPLTEIASIVTGNTPSRADLENFGNHIEWIKSDNINTPSHYLTRATEWLSKKGKEQGRTTPAGSTLMTCIAGSPDCIGNVALADREVAFNQQINAISPQDGIDPRYLYTLLLLGKRLVQNASTNSMKGMVSKGRLEQIHFPVPPVSARTSLQKNFATIFDIVIHIENRLRKAYEADDHLFSALVHRAFSGTH